MTTHTLARNDSTQNESSILTKLFGSSNGMMKSARSLLAGFNAVQTNVLIADSNFTLIYANPLAVHTLHSI